MLPHSSGSNYRQRILAGPDADITPAHLVRHGGGSARTEEGVEDDVARVCSYFKYPLYKFFWFYGIKNFDIWQQLPLMSFCLT